jgi:hypothetical protein
MAGFFFGLKVLRLRTWIKIYINGFKPPNQQQQLSILYTFLDNYPLKNSIFKRF